MYSASFIKAPINDREFLAKSCRTVEALLNEWRNLVPVRRTLGYAVHLYQGFPWIRVDGTLQRETEQILSALLHTEVLGIYAIDEHLLEFSLVLFHDGREVRSLRQDDDSVWTTVSGDEQDWEAAALFCDSDLANYQRFAKSEHQRSERTQVFGGRRIIEGADVPRMADWKALVRLSTKIGLPWLQVAEAPSSSFLIPPLEAPERRSWVRRFCSWIRDSKAK